MCGVLVKDKQNWVCSSWHVWWWQSISLILVAGIDRLCLILALVQPGGFKYCAWYWPWCNLNPYTLYDIGLVQIGSIHFVWYWPQCDKCPYTLYDIGIGATRVHTLCMILVVVQSVSIYFDWYWSWGSQDPKTVPDIGLGATMIHIFCLILALVQPASTIFA